MTQGIEAELIDLLIVFIMAAGVGIVVAKVGRFPYTIALLVAGFVASLAGVEVGIELTHDVILLVLLPPLLFEGAATTDAGEFREHATTILVLAVGGLAVSIVFVGVATHLALGLPLLTALLFGAIIMPTDPVSVLALFKELGVSERLAVLVEGESLVNDGVAVVIFAALLELVETGASAATLADPGRLGALVVGIFVSSAGGAVVGLSAGYLVYSVMVNLDEHMTEIVLTAILAFGSFLVAEHYLHVSGVIATVVSGLLIGNRGAEHAMSPTTKLSIFNTWETAAFIVNTFIFLVIGVKTPLPQILSNWEWLAVAVPIVLAGRAAAVYPFVSLTNALTAEGVSRQYQHVMVWGGLHASIPIALVLGLPPMPYRQQLRVMVFGIAAFSLVVQGLSMKWFVERLGITTTTDEERLYQLLVGRARAVDEALEAASELHTANRIPTDVHDRFTAEYRAEKEELDEAISQLLEETPEIKDRQHLAGERQLLNRERSALKSAELEGAVSTDVAAELLGEVNLKLDRVSSGESTVTRDPQEEGYREFWREEARRFDLLAGTEEERAAGTED